MPAPPLSDDIAASDLDAEVRRDLRGLQKETAEVVARHLVAAGSVVDDDPELALSHARYARTRASRIAVVREAAGIAAYHAGEWSEALGELRAARRMGGGPGHVAVMADIERALGRPERALELARGPELADLPPVDRIELAIVAAGARRDLGELDAAIVGLQIPALDPALRDPWSARLFYAYADNLLAAGRESDALQWFVHAHDADTDGETDAAARIADLTGEELEGDDVTFGEELFDEEHDAAPHADPSLGDDTDDTDSDDTETPGDAVEDSVGTGDVAATDVTAEDSDGSDSADEAEAGILASATADADSAEHSQADDDSAAGVAHAAPGGLDQHDQHSQGPGSEPRPAVSEEGTAPDSGTTDPAPADPGSTGEHVNSAATTSPEQDA